MKEKESTIKLCPQENMFDEYVGKVKDIGNRKNGLLYVGIILFNICTLALSWIIVSNKYGVAGLKEVMGVINWNYIVFIFLIVIIITLLASFSDFISVYKRTRKRRFISVYNANMKMNFYNSVTLFSVGGQLSHAVRLNDGGVDKRTAIDVTYLKKFFTRLSHLIYSFIFIIVGAILHFNSVNIWYFIAGIGCFLINCIILSFILFFDINKGKSINLVAKLCKLLFKMKLIKDYEKLFKYITNKLFIYSACLKSIKKMSIVYIISNVLIKFFRHFILFVILQAIDVGGYEALFEIIFKCTLLDLIISVLPMPQGTCIFELLFISLFNNLFVSGYVLWGMVLYRLFDYFIYIILHSIIAIFDRKKNNTMQEN